MMIDTRLTSLTGQVIYQATGEGIYKLQVEAWAAENQPNEPMGEAETDEDGYFALSADFRKFGINTLSDLYFKVYRGSRLLKRAEGASLRQPTRSLNETRDRTESTDSKKQASRVDVLIELDSLSSRAVGKDRLTALQVFKGADFLQKSDFKGVFADVKTKVSTAGGFVADLVMNTLTNLDIEPIRASTHQVTDVVGQDETTARQKLAAQQVEVNEVRTYNPEANTESVKSLANFPLQLKAGQKVDLYQENGIVRYYSLVDSKPTVQVQAADSERISRLQEELTAAKQDAAQKDEHIRKLQQEVDVLRADQQETKKLLSTERFEALKKEMDRYEKLLADRTRKPDQ